MRSKKSASLIGVLAAALLTTGMAVPDSAPDFDVTDPARVQSFVAAVDAPQLVNEQSESVITPNGAGTGTGTGTDEVVVEAEQGEVAFSFPASDESAVVLEDGATVFAADDEAFASVLRTQEGAAQITTVIASEASPTEYAYEFSGGAATLDVMDDGAVAVRDATGSLIGAVEAPWAFDAIGRPVPTWYQVDGLALIQVVDHTTTDFAYPLAADPTYSGKVLSKAFMGDYGVSGPGRKLQAWVSSYGRMLLIEDMSLFSMQGWNLLKGSFSAYLGGNVGISMKQQWDCHVIGGIAELGTFDLETWRAPNANWGFRIGTVWPLSAVCNW